MLRRGKQRASRANHTPGWCELPGSKPLQACGVRPFICSSVTGRLRPRAPGMALSGETAACRSSRRHVHRPPEHDGDQRQPIDPATANLRRVTLIESARFVRALATNPGSSVAASTCLENILVSRITRSDSATIRPATSARTRPSPGTRVCKRHGARAPSAVWREPPRRAHRPDWRPTIGAG